jgi:hypothetical protein
MRLLVSLFFFIAATGLTAEPSLIAPESLIAEPSQDPAWRELFTALAQPKTHQAHFEERRIFPFRKTAVVVAGELRISPEHGLSLHYFGDKGQIVIVDQKGALLRDERGRERRGPSDGRAEGATSALFSILRFDWPALQRAFEVHGARDEAGWTLRFLPRDSKVADLLGAITVHGQGPHLDRIAMVKSERQRIEIQLSEVKDDVRFSPEELQRYFR